MFLLSLRETQRQCNSRVDEFKHPTGQLGASDRDSPTCVEGERWILSHVRARRGCNHEHVGQNLAGRKENTQGQIRFNHRNQTLYSH